MDELFLVIGTVFAFLAAVIHLVIFCFESVLWSRPKVWRRFGITSDEDARTIQPMAFNQGFYNVFLAIGTGVGLVLTATENFHQAGVALTLFALISMLLASIVLISSSPKLARAAITQGAAPLLGVVFLLLSIAV
jgi:putative membrane protein